MYAPKTTLRMATEEEAAEVVEEAEAFIKFTNMYQDYRGLARTAVAEYIAATRGFTIRETLVGRTYERFITAEDRRIAAGISHHRHTT